MDQLNIQSNNEYSKKCSRHQQFKLNKILVQKSTKDHLICSKCMQDDKNLNIKFINVKEVLKNSDTCIIQNFPPLEDENLSIFLYNNFTSNNNDLCDITVNINSYFDNLRKQLIDTINKMQTETKLKVSTLINLRSQIMEVYNEISSKKELQNLLLSNQNEDNIQSKIKKIIEDKFNNISTNSSKIKEKIDNYRQLADFISFDTPKKIQENVQDMLNQIDFFNQLDFKIFNEQTQNVNKLNLKQMLQTRNIKDAIQLIKNPTNYCSQEYLNQVEDFLNKNCFIFNKIDEQNNQYDKEKQNIFCNLNQEQLENIRVLSQKILNIQNEKKNTLRKNETSQDLQYNSNVILNNLSKQNLFLNNKLKHLFQKYPIFELIEFNNICSINFIKSKSYGDSQNQEITRINEGQIQIQQSKSHSYGISYSDFILNPKKKYIFRIQIQSNTQSNTYIIIGLIPEQSKDNDQLYGSGLSYCEREEYLGISKVIKGGKVIEKYKEDKNKEIELRINLENKILKVANYPNYDNVAEIEYKIKIEENQQYRLATELHFIEHKIIITHFQIVDEFDNQM